MGIYFLSPASRPYLCLFRGTTVSGRDDSPLANLARCNIHGIGSHHHWSGIVVSNSSKARYQQRHALYAFSTGFWGLFWHNIFRRKSRLSKCKRWSSNHRRRRNYPYTQKYKERILTVPVFKPRPSPNFGSRDKTIKIDMLVIHYTGLPSTEVSLERMCDPKREVSAHYLIDEGGRIYQLVNEKNRAWHAGVSYWDGETDTNSRSIGIELQNPGYEWGYTLFPQLQMEALRELSQDIMSRYQISNRLVLGHSDVAPGRKNDPGHLFNWEWLAKSCLLYTSPSPRDRQKSRMPSSA